jgi:hypothetical protein
MAEVVTVVVKALNGGLFVVAFALIGEISVPKRFAGVFSAAPSVALANLLVMLVAKGSAEARDQTTGMIVGAVAMTAACAIGVVSVRRLRALRGSLVLCGAWFAPAIAGYLLFLL